LRALLAVRRNLGEQLLMLDQRARQFAKDSAPCRHLMTVPGVGIVTAIAFVTAVDDPAKFIKSKSVGAYLGLTPRRYQSGATDTNGRIFRCGDPLVRSYLYEAATVLLTRVRKGSALQTWGLRLVYRAGLKKARVAVARKLAVILHRMWSTGAAFNWAPAAATK
jgi:transposase